MITMALLYYKVAIELWKRYGICLSYRDLLICLVHLDRSVPGQDEGQVGECGMQALDHLKTMDSGQRHDICRIMPCKPICAVGDRRHGCLTECVRFGGSDGQIAVHGGCEDRTLNQVSII